MKHTPGPWKATHAGVVSTSATGANVICEAPIHYLDSAKNWEANAALIAKAPDMQAEIDRLRGEIEIMKRSKNWTAAPQVSDHEPSLATNQAPAVAAANATHGDYKPKYQKRGRG